MNYLWIIQIKHCNLSYTLYNVTLACQSANSVRSPFNWSNLVSLSRNVQCTFLALSSKSWSPCNAIGISTSFPAQEERHGTYFCWLNAIISAISPAMFGFLNSKSRQHWKGLKEIDWRWVPLDKSDSFFKFFFRQPSQMKVTTHRLGLLSHFFAKLVRDVMNDQWAILIKWTEVLANYSTDQHSPCLLKFWLNLLGWQKFHQLELCSRLLWPGRFQ